MVPNQEIILKYLGVIRRDTNKVLTNQHFTESQWLQYNSEKKQYEYEDHAPLGRSPLDVIKTFEHLLLVGVGRWLKDAKWRIKDKV